MEGIRIVKAIFVVFYAIIMVAVIACMCSVKYISLLPSLKDDTIVAFLCVFVVPILVSVAVHLKTAKNRVVYEICKIVVMLLVLGASVINAGLFMLGGVCSYTDDISDYHEFDDRVTELVSRTNILLPEEIPENAQDVTYRYMYHQTLDDVIGITLKYRYDEQSEFEKEKELIAQNKNILSVEEIEGRDIYYTAKGDRCIFASFDKREQEVTYGHFHHMEAFEIKDMLGDTYE